MKVRCIYKGSSFLEYNKVYEVLEETKTSHKVQDEDGCRAYFYKWKFKEDKMKKTVKEVINEIKEGEVWLSESKVKFYLKNNTLNIDYDNEFTTNKLLLRLDALLELERKEYTFQEAFKAYEEGKEIENCEECRFKLIDKDKTLIIDCAGDEMEYSNKTELFSVKEIRGKWYIND